MEPHDLTLQIAGKITLTEAAPGRPAGTYVYQRTAPGLGNIPADPRKALQLRRHVIPTDPATPAQQQRRATLAAAVQAWHDLTPTARQAWAPQAKEAGLSIYNAFLSDYLKNH